MHGRAPIVSSERKARSTLANDLFPESLRGDTLPSGQPVHSFPTLLAELATLVSNTCRTPHAPPDSPTFNVLTIPIANQHRALALINAIHV